MEKEAIVTEIYSYGSFPYFHGEGYLYNYKIHFNNDDFGFYTCKESNHKNLIFKIGKSIKYTLEKRNLRSGRSYNRIKPI